MQNWLFPESSPAPAVETHVDDPLDHVGQLYYAAMESATTDARSKLKETKTAIKKLRTEMKDAEKAGDYKLAAEKARECASKCDDALKAIDELPKSMPKAILLDVAITVILILGAALAWKALNKMQSENEKHARIIAAQEKAAEETEEKLSHSMTFEEERHAKVDAKYKKYQDESIATRDTAIADAKAAQDKLDAMRKSDARVRELEKRLNESVHTKNMRMLENSSPTMKKKFADFRADKYRYEEAGRKFAGMSKNPHASRTDLERARMNYKNAMDRYQDSLTEMERYERRVRNEFDPIWNPTKKTRDVVERRDRHIGRLQYEADANTIIAEKSNTNATDMARYRTREAVDHEEIKQSLEKNIRRAGDEKYREYLSNPTDAVKERVDEITKGSRTAAVAGKALSALAALIPGGAGVSQVIKALSAAVKSDKPIDSTDVNPFIAAYKADLKNAKKRYETIAAEYERLSSSVATESEIQEDIPALEGEYTLELDDIMESYGDIAIECVILDLADGLRPGFPDVNDTDEPAVEADCSWTFA